MKTKFLKYFTSVLTLTGVLAGMARAEILSVQVPFTFTAAGKSLPAGSYVVDSVETGILLIHATTGSESVAVQALSTEATGRSAKPGLIFNRSIDMPALSSVRMESGLTFTISPAKRLATAASLPSKGTVVLSHP